MADTSGHPDSTERSRLVGRANFDEHRSGLGAWFADRPALGRATMALGVAWVSAYLLWRAGWTLTGRAWWLSVPLFVGEVIAALALVMLVVFAWRPRSAPPRRRRRAEPVDIYVLAGSWDTEVLRSTLLACSEVRGSTRVWVLHHGRSDVAVLAAELGHLSLAVDSDDLVAAVTDACGRTGGDLVLVLEGSDLPLPDALDGFRAAFDDPWCAVLQLRRGAYNHESARHLGVGRDVRSVHDEVALPGLDSLGAAHWEGAGALLRRSAMLEVGSHSGADGALRATIALQSAGWSVRARPDLVAMGLAPDDAGTLIRAAAERRRAVLRLLTSPSGPWRARGLTVSQRLGHTVTAAGALQTKAWGRVLRVLVLAAALWTATTPFPLTAVTVGLLWLPATITAALAAAAARGGRLGASEVRGVELTRLALPLDRRSERSPITAPATLASLLSAGIALSVVRLATAGTATAGRFGLAALVTAGTIQLGWQLTAAWRHRRSAQRRLSHRFTCQEPAAVSGEPATVVDISLRGACVVLDRSPGWQSEVPVEMWLDTPDGTLAEVHTGATVRWCLPQGGRWIAGLDFDSPSRDALDRIARFCGVIRVTEEVRGLPPYLIDFIDDVDETAPPAPARFETTAPPPAVARAAV